MSWIDWIVVIVPVLFVLAAGMFTRRYIRGVSDYLSAGRVCGRYVISVGDIANALSIIGLAAYVEVQYKTGFALGFWSSVMLPLGILMGLTGYCTYRFRETKAMSLGQFLEMRYSRSFRVFAAALRSLSEILANMIMPAIAARFFIYFLDLPRTFSVFGFRIQTFMLIMFVVLSIAISLICMGGTLSLVVTDALQGMLCYPLLVVFVVFILCRFSWNNEIVSVMMDRAQGESFLNPYDISNLRDFNLFFLFLTFFVSIFHRASWIGAGTSSAAKSPHEQKMAGLLGTWRGAIGAIFYILIAIAILTVMNHQNFSKLAREIRINLCDRAAEEVAGSEAMRQRIVHNVAKIPEQRHQIGKDAPISEKNNLDTPYLETVHKTLLGKDSPGTHVITQAQETDGNSRFQQFRTLYHQLMMASSMRKILPAGMLGLFCLLMVLAMVSTDDSRIYSASLTITQDVILPLKKKPFTPEQHVSLLRWTSIGVGVFFFFGSLFMSQLDYINLFVTLVCSMWMGGCGPVMVFGLYSRFGTTAGAWTSLLTGMFCSFGTILIQRNWANAVYPFLQQMGWVEGVGNVLSAISTPMNPYIVWEMNPVKCPVNSYEFYFATMLLTLFLYVVVSLATCREPFNLERMLHRGKYAIDGEKKIHTHWTFRNVFSKLIGITPEYTKGDKFIAWFFFLYSFFYSFSLMFIVVVLWNSVSPWPIRWWGSYFYLKFLLIPGIMAFISAFWFGIGGVIDMVQLFRDLEKRIANPLDNGMVSGHMSLDDKAQLEAIDGKKNVK